MYEIHCLTSKRSPLCTSNDCSPFWGECYPVGENCCGPECDPSTGCCPDYEDDEDDW